MRRNKFINLFFGILDDYKEEKISLNLAVDSLETITCDYFKTYIDYDFKKSLSALRRNKICEMDFIMMIYEKERNFTGNPGKNQVFSEKYHKHKT